MVMARVKLGLTQTDAAIIVMSLVAVAMTGYVMILGVYGVHPITTTKNAVYHLTLVIITNNLWNSSTTQPRYWVLTPNGLESAQNITLPAHTLIVLTIIDYDSATPLPAQYAKVSGTVGGVVYLLNSTSASSDDPNLSTAQVVSELNPNTSVAHTFTIPQLGINIPVAPHAVEVAELYLNQTGVFYWQCMDPCGLGAAGWGGAMSTDGWMRGTVTVYNP